MGAGQVWALDYWRLSIDAAWDSSCTFRANERTPVTSIYGREVGPAVTPSPAGWGFARHVVPKIRCKYKYINIYIFPVKSFETTFDVITGSPLKQEVTMDFLHFDLISWHCPGALISSVLKYGRKRRAGPELPPLTVPPAGSPVIGRTGRTDNIESPCSRSVYHTHYFTDGKVASLPSMPCLSQIM